jgi:hypothetical protein
MILTEAEAKTKWCPFARAPEHQGTGQNREDKGAATESSLCLASGCMAWRVASPPPNIMVTTVPAGVGYCGLGGNPHSVL